MLVKHMNVDFEFQNENGLLVQLVHEGWNQINILDSKQGSKRGKHYHKENFEAFYIIKGKLKLILEQDGFLEETIFESKDMFMISPYQMHYFEFIEDTLMVSMYDKGVEYLDGSKDIYS